MEKSLNFHDITQNDVFCVMSVGTPTAPCASQRFFNPPTFNKMLTTRKHLTETEIGRLIDAAKQGRYPARDRCLIALMFRHGLRASEAAHLNLSDVDLTEGRIFVQRLKHGLSTTHPLRAPEPRLIQAWLKARTAPAHPAFFITERGTRMTRYQIHYLIRRYGELAGLVAHPHMLRHGCGFALADQGADTRLIQDYLGHRSIQNTVIYTAANAARFDKLWQ